jgi:hypothetical protein
MMRVHEMAGLAAAALLAGACASSPVSKPSEESPAPSVPSAEDPTPAGDGSHDPIDSAAPNYQRIDYPAGPYGLSRGAVLENFAFLGWKDPVAAGYDQTKLETVRLSDFYNPDGRSDVKLLWINASAVWCSVCQFEMENIKNGGVRATYGAKGVQLIGTLFEDNAGGPATPADLTRWGQATRHSIDFPLLLDPGFKLGAFFVSDATPLNMLVDATTMQVLDTTMGYSADYWQTTVDGWLARLE